MNCKKCNSDRMMAAGAKCSDMFNCEIKGADYESYVPGDIGIGGGDYIEITYCMDCGQMVGDWPLPLCDLETNPPDIEDGDVIYFFDNHFTEGQIIGNINYAIIKSIIHSAYDESEKLGKWFEEFYKHNRYKGSAFPCSQTFLDMYRANNVYIENDLANE